jgi:hypothetical protein
MEKTGSSTNSKEMSVRKDKKKENNENESKSTTTKPTASRGDSKDKEVNKKENDDKKTKTTKIEYGTTSNGKKIFDVYIQLTICFKSTTIFLNIFLSNVILMNIILYEMKG